MENIELFNRMKDWEIDELLGILGNSPKVFKSGKTIWQEGEKIGQIPIVLVGEVEIFTTNIDGSENILAYAKDGEAFGLKYICSGLKVSPISARTKKQTGILFLSYEKLLCAIQTPAVWQKQFLKNIFELLSKENLVLNERTSILDRKSIRNKILAYLNIYAKKVKFGQSFEIPLSREELANYLCVDRSALSREISNLHREGVLEYKKNEFKLIKK